jgi:hypothetical protein
MFLHLFVSKGFTYTYVQHHSNTAAILIDVMDAQLPWFFDPVVPLVWYVVDGLNHQMDH